MIRQIIFKAFLVYQHHFPVQRGKAWLAHHISRLTGSIPMQLENGIWLSLYPDSAMDRSYLAPINKSPHRDIERLVDQLRAGDHILDIGANAGYITSLAARKVGPNGRVFAFEPSPREFERLEYALQRNGFSQVTAFPYALSDKPGELELEVSLAHTGVNKLSNAQTSSDARTVTVPVRRAVDVKELSETFRLVKIDVEGAELKVLRGLEPWLRHQRIEQLIVEVSPKFLHEFGDTQRNLYDYLEGFGYQPQWEEPDNWQWDQLFAPGKF